MEEFSMNVRGNNIYYKHSGSGPCIVLLHGIPTNSGLWDGMIPYLEKSYSVYAFDLLGFGESDRPDSSQINIKFQADFLVEVFNKLSLKDITVVGHDIGGGIAQIMAISNPKLFRAMVLIDSACYDSWPINLLSEGQKLEMLFMHLPCDVQYSLFLDYMKDGLYNKDKADTVAKKYWKYIEGKEGIKAFLNAVESFDSKYTIEVSKLLFNIKMPVLILWGKGDVFIKRSYGYRLSEDIRNSVIEIFNDAGHFLPEDQPEKAAAAIDGFIKNILTNNQ